MASVLLHFVLGTLGSLALFLFFTYRSGERSFSAPFGAVVVGISCASLSWFLSPWATPVILVLYALASASELRRERNMG